jgi:hypothetical protein
MEDQQTPSIEETRRRVRRRRRRPPVHLPILREIPPDLDDDTHDDELFAPEYHPHYTWGDAKRDGAFRWAQVNGRDDAVRVFGERYLAKFDAIEREAAVAAELDDEYTPEPPDAEPGELAADDPSVRHFARMFPNARWLQTAIGRGVQSGYWMLSEVAFVIEIWSDEDWIEFGRQIPANPPAEWFAGTEIWAVTSDMGIRLYPSVDPDAWDYLALKLGAALPKWKELVMDEHKQLLEILEREIRRWEDGRMDPDRLVMVGPMKLSAVQSLATLVRATATSVALSRTTDGAQSASPG